MNGPFSHTTVQDGAKGPFPHTAGQERANGPFPRTTVQDGKMVHFRTLSCRKEQMVHFRTLPSRNKQMNGTFPNTTVQEGANGPFPHTTVQEGANGPFRTLPSRNKQMNGLFRHTIIISPSLQWFTSYLSSRTSAVSIPPHLSPSSSLTCGVPQGSILGSNLFNLYTSPLGTLISSSTISHLLYADDTQLFVSFTPNNFLLSSPIYSQPFHLFHPGCHQTA